MIQDYQVSKPRRSFKRIVIMAVVLIALVAFALFVYAYVKINRPQSSVSVPVTVVIEKGAGTSEIAAELKKQDVIASTRLFIGYSMLTGASGKIQAGEYELNKKMTMGEILDVMTQGKVSSGNEKRFTVIEGWTNAQVIRQMEQRGVTTESGIAAALNADYDFEFASDAKPFKYEGFLFPDTYQFHADWTDKERVELILQNFESKITDKMLTDMEAKGLTMHEVITMASIVEREVGRNPSVTLTGDVLETMQDEREKVASVFYNRLEIGMALQSDATVNYVTGKSDRQALLSDLEVDSRYNTYKYPGLPPGPISNPGLGSIMAAIYPDDTDFVYFLSDIVGTAYFARTLEEHGENRRLYLD